MAARRASLTISITGVDRLVDSPLCDDESGEAWARADLCLWPRESAADRPDAEIEAKLRLGVRHGQTICTGILLEAPAGIEARALRRIPLGFLVDACAGALASETLGALVEWPNPPRAAGRPGYTDEHLRRVARIYRKAVEDHPRNPVVKVIEEYKEAAEAAGQRPPSAATVKRWIKRAREGDTPFLGPARPGKAGEGHRPKGGGSG
jgi:hypothetical protein